MGLMKTWVGFGVTDRGCSCGSSELLAERDLAVCLSLSFRS